MRRPFFAIAALTVLLAAGACTESRLRDAADFGDAARADRAAQIAEPDARYAGVPTAGSNGMRVDAAQERYNHGAVIQPASTETSSVTNAGGSGNSGSGGAAAAPSAGQ